MPFKKGQSGNPKKQFTSKNQPKNPGRPRKLPELDAILADILGEEKDGKTALNAICAALRAKAAKGDVRAAEVLMNRAYGLAKQPIDLTGEQVVNINVKRT